MQNTTSGTTYCLCPSQYQGPTCSLIAQGKISLFWIWPKLPSTLCVPAGAKPHVTLNLHPTLCFKTLNPKSNFEPINPNPSQERLLRVEAATPALAPRPVRTAAPAHPTPRAAPATASARLSTRDHNALLSHKVCTNPFLAPCNKLIRQSTEVTGAPVSTAITMLQGIPRSQQNVCLGRLLGFTLSSIQYHPHPPTLASIY